MLVYVVLIKPKTPFAVRYCVHCCKREGEWTLSLPLPFKSATRPFVERIVYGRVGPFIVRNRLLRDERTGKNITDFQTLVVKKKRKKT